MNIEKINLKAIERGYWLHNKTVDNKRLNYIKDNGIGLLVYPETEEFEIYYNIDLCTNIKVGRCGSFMNDKHFKFHENRLERHVDIIKSVHE